MIDRWQPYRATYHNALFLHWPLPPDTLQDRVPTGTALDTYDDTAYLTAVVLRLTDARLAGLPRLPGLNRFHQVNLRTYVTANDTPGVSFLSLDLNHPLAAPIPRLWHGIPSHLARITHRSETDVRTCRVRRLNPFAPRLQLDVTAEAAGPRRTAEPGSRAAWLLERYAFYATPSTGPLQRTRIDHVPCTYRPGRLVDATADIDALADRSHGPASPVVHLVDDLEIAVHASQPAASADPTR